MSRAELRGGEILGELQKVLLRIYEFDEQQIIDWAEATHGLIYACKQGKDPVGLSNTRSERAVDYLQASYQDNHNKNPSFACAEFMVAAHIESERLSGDDAKLVHGLTKLHISRATALLRSRTQFGQLGPDLAQSDDSGAQIKALQDVPAIRRRAGFLPLWSVSAEAPQAKEMARVSGG